MTRESAIQDIIIVAKSVLAERNPVNEELVRLAIERGSLGFRAQKTWAAGSAGYQDIKSNRIDMTFSEHEEVRLLALLSPELAAQWRDMLKYAYTLGGKQFRDGKDQFDEQWIVSAIKRKGLLKEGEKPIGKIRDELAEDANNIAIESFVLELAIRDGSPTGGKSIHTILRNHDRALRSLSAIDRTVAKEWEDMMSYAFYLGRKMARDGHRKYYPSWVESAIRRKGL